MSHYEEKEISITEDAPQVVFNNNTFLSENPKVPTWKFKGKEYPCYVANKQDSIGIQIKHPVTEKVVGILNARFQWENSEPFLERLDMDFKDVRDAKEGIIERQQRNFTRQSAKLFKAICVGGSLVKINEFDEHSEPIEKTIDQMRGYAPETQADLVNKWINNFHIERYFADDVDELDALLGAVTEIQFVAYIGARKDPSNAILFTFNVPSEDARRSYDDNSWKRQIEKEGTTETTYLDIKNNVKIQYAKKHLSSVSGACVEVNGELVYPIADLKEFKGGFNPEWFILLADALQDTFRIAGK